MLGICSPGKNKNEEIAFKKEMLGIFDPFKNTGIALEDKLEVSAGSFFLFSQKYVEKGEISKSRN